MKLRNHICFAVLLGIGLTVLFTGTNALGQGLQPPFMAPTPPSLMYGAFYFQAGVKYRNVDQFRFDVIARPNSMVVNPGTVPFGPTTSGNFGVGTGITGFTGGAATAWVYDNGFISGDVIPPNPPNNNVPPAIPVNCLDTTVTPNVTVTCNRDRSWAYSVIQPVIGRFIADISGSATQCCANKGTAPSSQGSFVIDDPTTQVNNIGSMASTTQVTFQIALDDGLAFSLSTTPDFNRVVESNVWGPTFEFGYQFSNFFDLFYGFSWFNTSNSMVLSNTIQGQAALTMIQDTFPFVSDDTAAWPISLGSVQSSSSINLASTATQNYHIATNSPLLGIFPNRQFLTQVDASIPAENIQETLSTTAEFTPFENRFGARSWAPLFGLGRIGATLGTAIIPTYYKITGSSSYIASGSSGTVPAGTVLSAQVSDNKDWRTLYGLFVGGDLSLGNTGYFLYASGDYMWATNLNYELNAVRTTFNPGGFTAALNAGIQF